MKPLVITTPTRKHLPMRPGELHNRDESKRAWPALAAGILGHLTAEDDPGFWEVACDVLFVDASLLCRKGSGRKLVLARVGACSHWLRPHQTRWTAGGGFAWPSGYDGPSLSRTGLPEFDWSVGYRWNSTTASWQPDAGSMTKGSLVFRVALPTRTARHSQAAVHTLWAPGTPVRPRQRLVQFYGFRKQQGRWCCTAYLGDEEGYEVVAAGPP